MTLRIAPLALAIVTLVSPGCLFVLEDPDYDGRFDFDYTIKDERSARASSRSSSRPERRERDRVVLQRSETIGPFSEGISSGPFFFSSGQIPRDTNGDVVTDDATLGTKRVLEGLSDTLGAVGLGLEDVVKVTVFLKNMEDYAAMNEVYASYFGDDPPARSTVEVSALALDAVVEIDLIAVRR